MTGMQAIQRFVDKDVTCYMATVEGDWPRVRPMATAIVDEASLLFATSDASDKMQQILANPKVEMCYMGPDWDHVRIRGQAERIEDDKTRQYVWDEVPQLQQYWESADAEDYALIRVHVKEVLYMDVPDKEYRSLDL